MKLFFQLSSFAYLSPDSLPQLLVPVASITTTCLHPPAPPPSTSLTTGTQNQHLQSTYISHLYLHTPSPVTTSPTCVTGWGIWESIKTVGIQCWKVAALAISKGCWSVLLEVESRCQNAAGRNESGWTWWSWVMEVEGGGGRWRQ